MDTKVTLIFPGLGDEQSPVDADSWLTSAARRIAGLGGSNYTPPLSLLMLAAVTPPDVEVRIVDERFGNADFDQPVDLVGITAVTRTAPRAYRIADDYRRRGIPVVLGGIHPTVMPDEAIQHADAVVIGEGDAVWPRVVEDARHQCLQRFYRAERPVDLDTLPTPRRELVPAGRYMTMKALTATRGCPNSCTFCSAGSAVGKRYRTRRVESVVAELEELPGKVALFLDDNLGWDVEYAKRLFRALIPLKLRWFGELSLNAVEDPELVELAAESGCLMLEMGFESLSPAVIASVRKTRTNDPTHYRSLIKRVHDCGLPVVGNFVVGFDGDGPAVFRELADFVGETRIDLPGINVLVPYPGTAIYREMEREGRLLHKDWGRYDVAAGVVYRPLHMSAEELWGKYLTLYEEVFSWQSIAKRLTGVRTLSACLPFLLQANVQNRRIAVSARVRQLGLACGPATRQDQEEQRPERQATPTD